MIVHTCEQGGIEWMQKRLGRPTASQFGKLITVKKGQPSTSAHEYRGKLLAEWMLGMPLDFDATQFMDRGTNNEAKARKWYAMVEDVDVEEVGFCTDDLDQYGCSPDLLVTGERRGGEIKCLGPAAHMNYLTADDEELKRTEFHPQIQGSLLVTGYERWDLILFHEQLPGRIITYYRDDVFLHSLKQILDRFCAELREAQEKLIAQGYHAPDPAVENWMVNALKKSMEAQG